MYEIHAVQQNEEGKNPSNMWRLVALSKTAVIPIFPQILRSAACSCVFFLHQSLAVVGGTRIPSPRFLFLPVT